MQRKVAESRTLCDYFLRILSESRELLGWPREARTFALYDCDLQREQTIHLKATLEMFANGTNA